MVQKIASFEYIEGHLETILEGHVIAGILVVYQWKSDFGNDSYAVVAAYEGTDFFKVGDRKGMLPYW